MTFSTFGNIDGDISLSNENLKATLTGLGTGSTWSTLVSDPNIKSLYTIAFKYTDLCQQPSNAVFGLSELADITLGISAYITVTGNDLFNNGAVNFELVYPIDSSNTQTSIPFSSPSDILTDDTVITLSVDYSQVANQKIAVYFDGTKVIEVSQADGLFPPTTGWYYYTTVIGSAAGIGVYSNAGQCEPRYPITGSNGWSDTPVELSEVAKVRLIVGDTGTPPILSDDVYEYALEISDGDVFNAALFIARRIAAKYAKSIDQEVGDNKVWASQCYQNYLDLIKMLEDEQTRSRLGKGSFYAGGISISDMRANNNNTDNRKIAIRQGFRTDISGDLFDKKGFYQGDYSDRKYVRDC